MNVLNVLYHLALADFYERARQYRFLLTLAAVILMGVLVNNGSFFFCLQPGDFSRLAFRGEYNSAWVGTMIVLVTNTFLGLFGFYLVSDCIARDIRTGVGQIIATTPVRRATYLVGKWISNFAVLAVLELILAGAAAVMVLLRQEAALELGALLMPFLAAALPYMALIAALSVVFETVPGLRGALGNAIYFFLWLGVIVASMLIPIDFPFLKDPMGFGIFRPSLYAAALAAYPNDTIFGMSVMGDPGRQFRIFPWPGPEWVAGLATQQWLWAVLGLGLILLSAAWFARFDPARERHSRAREGHSRAREGHSRAREGQLAARSKPGEASGGAEPAAASPAGPRIRVPNFALPSLSPLISKLAVNPFLGILFAELRLLLNGRRWWWWLVIAGLNLAILGNLPAELKPFLLPFAWLWPLPIWSEMGNRERKNNTSQMVFSSARPVLRQLPAAWLAGVFATALFSIANAVALLSNGDLLALAGWLGAIIFIPTLALALGVISSGNRVFEVVYLIWWYVGPFQRTAGFDFTAGTPQIYLLAAAGLLLLAAYWRGRQVRV